MCSHMAVWHAYMLAKQCYIGIEVRILVLKHCRSVMCALTGLLRQVYTTRYSSDCGIPTIPIFGAFLLYLVPHLSTYSETLLQFFSLQVHLAFSIHRRPLDPGCDKWFWDSEWNWSHSHQNMHTLGGFPEYQKNLQLQTESCLVIRFCVMFMVWHSPSLDVLAS